MIKLCIYRAIYFKRISIASGGKINGDFSFNLRRNTKTVIGKNFKARKRLNIRNEKNGVITIKDNVFFNDNVSINCIDTIFIGSNTNIGHNVIIIDHDHNYKEDMKQLKSEKIYIGSNVWIGANCIILKGSIIPDNTVVAAGTVYKEKVTNDNNDKVVIYNKRNLVVKGVG